MYLFLELFCKHFAVGVCCCSYILQILQISQWSPRYGGSGYIPCSMNATLVCGRYNPFLSLFLRCGCLSVWATPATDILSSVSCLHINGLHRVTSPLHLHQQTPDFYPLVTLSTFQPAWGVEENTPEQGIGRINDLRSL